MKIGLLLPQAIDDGPVTWTGISDLARQAEEGGADSLWLIDHFLHRGEGVAIGDEIGVHEPWTLLSALASTTNRVELGTLVLSTSFRPAALLAKMAATADEVSGGRLILGIGCGWHEPEYTAFGFPFDHRVGRFEDSIRITAPLVRGERVTYDGPYQHVQDAAILPPPIRPDLPILVAAKGERMLRLTAELADLWQTAWFGHPDERFRTRHRDLLAACDEVGRDPGTIGITVGVDVSHEPGPNSLPFDAAAIAGGLAAWDAEGADHIQLGVRPATAATYEIVLDAICRYRG
jgi:alkanesulfonate monooxygenase SsuD/methylene tetrahydromethanopterin reductase-like flavin-dependent oxidoreductase (luciferase family)